MQASMLVCLFFAVTVLAEFTVFDFFDYREKCYDGDTELDPSASADPTFCAAFKAQTDVYEVTKAVAAAPDAVVAPNEADSEAQLQLFKPEDGAQGGPLIASSNLLENQAELDRRHRHHHRRQHDENHRRMREFARRRGEERSEDMDFSSERNPVLDSAKRWPKGFVPFSFVDTLTTHAQAGGYALSKAPTKVVDNFAQSAGWWEKQTCLNFKRYPEADNTVTERLFVGDSFQAKGICGTLNLGWETNRNTFLWMAGEGTNKKFTITCDGGGNFKIKLAGKFQATEATAFARQDKTSTVEVPNSVQADTETKLKAALDEVADSNANYEVVTVTTNKVFTVELKGKYHAANMQLTAVGAAPTITSTGPVGEDWPYGCPPGTMAHEAGHVVGLEHTHQRDDAATFFTIDTTGFDANTLFQYEVRGSSYKPFPFNKDDFEARKFMADSIMMYNLQITTKDWAPLGTHGAQLTQLNGMLRNRQYLARIDAWTINKFYECIRVTSTVAGTTKNVYVRGDWTVEDVRSRLSDQLKKPLATTSTNFVKNQQRTLTIANAGSGTFTLAFDGKTATVTVDADADQQRQFLEDALETSWGTGNTVVGKAGAGAYLITYTGDYAGVDLADKQVTVDITGITAAGGVKSVTIVDTVVGGPVLEVQTLEYKTTPNAGSYTLTLGSFHPTASIAFNAGAAAIKDALSAVLQLERDVEVVQVTEVTAGSKYDIKFLSPLGEATHSAMTVTKSKDWGTGDVTVTQKTAGQQAMFDYPPTKKMSDFGLTTKSEFSFVGVVMTKQVSITKGSETKTMYYNPAWPLIAFRSYIKTYTGLDAGANEASGVKLNRHWSIGTGSDATSGVIEGTGDNTLVGAALISGPDQTITIE